MADRIPVNYRKSSDIVQNVDFFDLAQGVGYKTLYGVHLSGTAVLSTFAFPSMRRGTLCNLSDTSGAWALLDPSSTNWDLALNHTLNLLGDVIVSIPVEKPESNGGITIRADAVVSKVVGAAVTQLAAVSGATLNFDLTAGASATLTMKANIASRQTINAGDTFRVTTRLYERNASSPGQSLSIWHTGDPQTTTNNSLNISGTSLTGWATPTDLKVLIPVVLDI